MTQVAERGEEGHKIPIRNLWFLLVYAMEMPELAGKKDIAIEKSPDLPDLVVNLLVYVVEGRLRRNLTRSYVTKKEALTRVRGRIDLLRTTTEQTLERGEVVCSFEDLSVDTVRNRFVMTALLKAAGLDIPSTTKQKCRRLAQALQSMGVRFSPVSPREMSTHILGRNDAGDRPMIELSHMVFDLALLAQEEGKHQLYSPHRDDLLLRRIFECAIGQFYKYHLRKDNEWGVRTGEWIYWPVTERSQGLDSYLPNMKTDIILRHASTKRCIVIDTKFTDILKPGRHGGETFKSGYIYQMYAYLKAQVRREEATQMAGILLHPSIGKEIDEYAVIHGDVIRFVTVNLNKSPEDIHERLISLTN